MKEQDVAHFTEYQVFYQTYKAKITSLEKNIMLTKEDFVSSRNARVPEGTHSSFLDMWIIIA